MSEGSDVPVGKLILVPAVITFAVTLLRLVGELQHWSPRFFNPAAGGVGAVVGIVWLAPLFGIVFAVQLRNRGHRPSSFARAFGFPLLALLLFPLVFFLLSFLKPGPLTQLGVGAVASIAVIIVGMKGWPVLGRVLLAYAFAARIPVAIVMLIAMIANWGTHYDVAGPGFPPMGTFAKWVLIGLIPQMTLWIAFTIVTGGLTGGLTGVLMGRPRTVDAPRTTSPAVG